MITAADVEKVERLIRLSERNAVLPDEFIPWEMKENNELLMPEEIVSLHAVEGGDGGSRAFFKYDKGKWKLYKYAYFSYF